MLRLRHLKRYGFFIFSKRIHICAERFHIFPVYFLQRHINYPGLHKRHGISDLLTPYGNHLGLSHRKKKLQIQINIYFAFKIIRRNFFAFINIADFYFEFLEFTFYYPSAFVRFDFALFRQWIRKILFEKRKLHLDFAVKKSILIKKRKFSQSFKSRLSDK